MKSAEDDDEQAMWTDSIAAPHSICTPCGCLSHFHKSQPLSDKNEEEEEGGGEDGGGG